MSPEATTSGDQAAVGEWRTVRNPPAPLAVGTALAYLLSEAAALAREGQGGRAIAIRQSLDVIRDFVHYEPPTAASGSES